MALFVCLSVGWLVGGSVGRSVCLNFKFHIHAPLGALIILDIPMTKLRITTCRKSKMLNHGPLHVTGPCEGNRQGKKRSVIEMLSHPKTVDQSSAFCFRRIEQAV